MLVTSEQLGPTQYFKRLSVNSNKVTKLVHPLATYIHGVKCHVLMYSYQMQCLFFKITHVHYNWYLFKIIGTN